MVEVVNLTFSKSSNTNKSFLKFVFGTYLTICVLGVMKTNVNKKNSKTKH